MHQKWILHFFHGFLVKTRWRWTTLQSFIKQSHSKTKHSWKRHWNLLHIFIDIFLRGARWRITFCNMKQSILNFFATIHFPLNNSYSSKTFFFLFLSPKPHRTPSLAGSPKYPLPPKPVDLLILPTLYFCCTTKAKGRREEQGRAVSGNRALESTASSLWFSVWLILYLVPEEISTDSSFIFLPPRELPWQWTWWLRDGTFAWPGERNWVEKCQIRSLTLWLTLR